MTMSAPTSTPGPERSEGPGVDAQAAPVPFQQLQITRASPYSRNEKIRRLAWNVARTLLFRPSPKHLFRWRNVVLRWFGARIGPNTFIEPTVRIFHPWLLTI